MDTIDNLPDHLSLDSDSTSNLSVSPLNFRLFLASVCSDRIAYYGIRSILILYAIAQFEASEETAFYHYSFLTLVVCLAQLLGGFLGDFLWGATRGILVGFGICITGAIIVSINDPIVYYIGVFLIACGTGFSRANSFSFISHFTQKNPVLLEKRFIALYGFINIGAFVSSILIGLIGEFFGYFYSFILVLVFYALSFGLVFIISRGNKKNTADLPAETTGTHSVSRRAVYVILAFVGSAIFWILFERFSMNISYSKIEFIQELQFSWNSFSIMLGTTAVLSLILIIPYYFLAKYFSIYVKIAIALILIGICWGISSLFFGSDLIKIGLGSFILFTLFEVIADIFLTPSILTLLARSTRRKYYGLMFGLYSFSLYGGMQLLYLIESSNIGFIFQIILIILLVASIVFFFLLPYLFKSRNSKTVSLEDEL